MFKKATAGQPINISAHTWNQMQEVVQKELKKQVSHSSEHLQTEPFIIIKNTTEEDLEVFNVLGIDDAVVVDPTADANEFKFHFTLEGVEPAAHINRYAILQEPIEAGEFGRAICFGVTVAKVNVVTECHKFAEMKKEEYTYLESGDTGSALILYKESGTGEKWAVIKIDDSGGLVQFSIDEKIEYLDDNTGTTTADPIKAKILGSSQEIYVEVEPPMTGAFGPADIGFTGWGQRVEPCEEELDRPLYRVVHMQRFARLIKFTANFQGSCQQNATVDAYYNGEDPSVWQVVVTVDDMPCTCLGEEEGYAYIDDKSSLYPYLYYKVINIDQFLYAKQIADCTTNPCGEGWGSATRNLYVSDGLTLETLDCSSGSPRCSKRLTWDGLTLTAKKCDPESESEEDETTDGVKEIKVNKPLEVEVSETAECPQTATLYLPDDFIDGDGDCITVEKDDETCKYTVSFEESCKTEVVGGDCITVTESPTGTFTVDNDFDITAGTGITISGSGCDKTISATGETANGLEAGDCIELEESGGTTTINATTDVVGGNGVIVSKSGCTYSVSLSGSQGDPLTTIEYLCDIDISISPISITCVESSGGTSIVASGGEITVTKSYGSIDLPSAIISNASSDCGGSGGSGGSGGEILTCDDCPDCEAGEQKIIKDDATECDCISDSASMPEGWTQCDGSSGGGGGLTLNSINCDHYQPYLSFTFNGMPDGAASYEIDVNPSTMPGLTLGPSYDHEEDEGQEYWGALCSGWTCTIPEGECFSFTVTFRDASGTAIRTDDPIEICCDD